MTTPKACPALPYHDLNCSPVFPDSYHPLCIAHFCYLSSRLHSCGFLQPINIQTASGAVETAVLHLFEQLSANEEAAAPAPAPAPDVVASPGSSSLSVDNMRVCALHQRSPIHMFMFDNKGALLIANKAAMEALQPGELCKPACILVSAPYEMMSCLSFAFQQSAQGNCCLRNRSNNPSAVTVLFSGSISCMRHGPISVCVIV